MLENSLDSSLPSSLGWHLLHDFQNDFPLCPAPFAELAVQLGVAESVVLRMFEELRRQGKIARVGAVFAPKRIGASTLAAMAVPDDRLAALAEAINRFPEVTHNYTREHRYNLWFVATAGSEGRLQAALGAIEASTGYRLLRLPLLREYLFDAQGVAAGGASVAHDFAPPDGLGEVERRLVMALQEGLPFFIRPFSVLASRLGCAESDVLERIRRWCAEGVIKRFGVVLRPLASPASAEALLVQDVADDQVARLGSLLARAPGVTLCYQRPRALPDWPYNLFCAISGATRSEVRARVAELRQRLGLTAYACDLLFALQRSPAIS